MTQLVRRDTLGVRAIRANFFTALVHRTAGHAPSAHALEGRLGWMCPRCRRNAASDCAHPHVAWDGAFVASLAAHPHQSLVRVHTFFPQAGALAGHDPPIESLSVEQSVGNPDGNRRTKKKPAGPGADGRRCLLPG
jgi:hypothetical protein